MLIEGSESGYFFTQAFYTSQALQLVAQGGARPVFDPALNSGVYGGGYGGEAREAYRHRLPAGGEPLRRDPHESADARR